MVPHECMGTDLGFMRRRGVGSARSNAHSLVELVGKCGWRWGGW
jgi:hypothetical protein